MNRVARVVSAPTKRRADWWVFGVIGLLTAWTYLSGARPGGAFTSAMPLSYYGLLTEALVSGQLHLKITPDPKLALLADPYAGPQGVLRPHDMSYYRGRFYLYYGVTPAAILFVPWKVLTGTYLNEVSGTAIFCLGGGLFSAWWLLETKRRLFPTLRSGWLAVVILLLAFGSPVFFLANNPTFYAVPIGAAFFCLMVGVVAVDRALLAQRVIAQAGWLLLASLWLGLSVGARPIYVLALPMLAIPTSVLWWRQKAPTRFRWPAMSLWLAAIIPAAAIGLLLAAYNYRRFGSPFDFGIQWSLGSSNQRGLRMIGTEFIGKNLRLYLTATAEYVRYYPFLQTNNRPFGVLPHFPIVAVALLLPLTWWCRNLRRDRAWMSGSGLILGATAANFAMLSLFFGGEDRYLVDFVPGLMLVAGATLLALMAPETAFSRRARLASGGAFLVAAAFTLFNGIFFALPVRPNPSGRLWFERLANRPAQAWEILTGTRHGPLELDVRFPSGLASQSDPLVTTGNLRGTGDIVYVHYEDREHARFGFFHVGAGGPTSEPIKLDFAIPHHIVVRAGSLLPPAGHPMFAKMTPAQVAAERRRLEIIVDGQKVLQGAASFYPSAPDRIYLGQNPLAGTSISPRFRGEIVSTRRQPRSTPTMAQNLATGPVRLRVRFPTGHPGVSEPLVATGVSGAGDIFFVTYVGTEHVKFGHDNFGGGGRLTTREIAVDFSRPHEIEVEMGSLYSPDDPVLRGYSAGAVTRLNRRFSVRLDGALVIATTEPFAPSAADQVEFGFNTIGSSSAEEMFTGAIDRIERPGPPAPAAADDAWGPIRLTIAWPTGVSGAAEPLLTTGTIGAADIVYVQYVDARHVRFGLDHWGAGGPLSNPIEIDPSTPQTVDIDLGSLYPPATHALWRSRQAGDRAQRIAHTEVKLGGRTVLSSAVSAYAASADELAVGENYLGASTCRPAFSGRMVAVERLPW